MLKDGKRHAQKAAFARVATLAPRLEAAGLSADALWQWVKNHYDVSSRSELTEEQWVVVGARLFTAQQNSHMFDNLCNFIRQSVHICRVDRIDNDTGKQITVYEGMFMNDTVLRCMKHADASGCVVNLHNADGQGELREFKPIEWKRSKKPPIGPYDKTKPECIFEIRVENDGMLIRHVQIPSPDTPRLHEWCHQYVMVNDVTIFLTDRLGHHELRRYSKKKVS